MNKYRKITSLNPTEYKSITLKEALVGYAKYIQYCSEDRYTKTSMDIKSFKQWMLTEI